jgi:hypothetical protein
MLCVIMLSKLSAIMLGVVYDVCHLLSVIMLGAIYAVYHYAECPYAESHHAVSLS